LRLWYLLLIYVLCHIFFIAKKTKKILTVWQKPRIVTKFRSVTFFDILKCHKMSHAFEFLVHNLNGFYYWKQYFRTLAWGSIGSNPFWFELTSFRSESNRGPANYPNLLSSALFSTELWWRMHHGRSFRTLLIQSYIYLLRLDFARNTSNNLLVEITELIIALQQALAISTWTKNQEVLMLALRLLSCFSICQAAWRKWGERPWVQLKVCHLAVCFCAISLSGSCLCQTDWPWASWWHPWWYGPSWHLVLLKVTRTYQGVK